MRGFFRNKGIDGNELNRFSRQPVAPEQVRTVLRIANIWTQTRA
jgi:hypothetical protein